MFWVTVRRHSVSLLKFLFLAMSKFFCVKFCVFVAWNVYTVVFLPIFSRYCCSVDLYAFPVVVISLSLLLFMQCSSRLIDVSMKSLMLAKPLPPYFLDTGNQSMSSLGCKAFCIIITFLHHLSICKSFPSSTSRILSLRLKNPVCSTIYP